MEHVNGVLVVDKYGLPIESSGNINSNQSGIVSAIMKNATKISQILAKQDQ